MKATGGVLVLLFLQIVSLVEGQGLGASPQSKRIAAQKCNEYTKILNRDYEILPLVAGGAPQIISIPICEQGGEQLIVGGQPAKEGEFPHMAAIGYRKIDNEYEWACGGTLISENMVLSAAHCTGNSRLGEAAMVRLGTNSLNGNQANLQEVSISDIIRHDGYKPRARYHDIALFKLAHNVRITKLVRPACLHTDESANPSNVIATGWGRTENGGPTSKILLKVGLNTYDNDECTPAYSRILANGITDSLICAGYRAGGKDTCNGDSGGPLVISKEHYQCIYYAIGVTSFGKICAARNLPSIYTRVASYTDWIVSNTWGNP